MRQKPLWGKATTCGKEDYKQGASEKPLKISVQLRDTIMTVGANEWDPVGNLEVTQSYLHSHMPKVLWVLGWGAGSRLLSLRVGPQSAMLFVMLIKGSSILELLQATEVTVVPLRDGRLASVVLHTQTAGRAVLTGVSW